MKDKIYQLSSVSFYLFQMFVFHYFEICFIFSGQDDLPDVDFVADK